MKSLKRTLCLVLALVMVLGLFGIASATSFTDDNTIQYKEAVDVMTGIGAISGYTDGTFNPKGTITRAEAAKLVTYAVLGKATADRLVGSTTSSFTDVTAAYSWAIPSIEYLVKQGVINGRGDGTFDPQGQITSTATLKMLLCALGYGKKGEYTGTGWDLQVVLDANKYGLTKGRTSTASIDTAATREEVALYCFNTIQTPLVEYISTLDIYATYNSSLGNKLGTIMGNVYGEGNGNLKVVPADKGGVDAFGAPANEWSYKGNDIGKYAVPATFTYTTAKSTADLAKELKGYTVRAAKAESAPGKDDAVLAVKAQVNGTDGRIVTTENLVASLAADATTPGFTGYGTTVKIYANDAKVIQNVVVIKELLTSVQSIDKATGNIALKVESLDKTVVSNATAMNTVTKDNPAYSVIAGAAKGDYVVVIPIPNAVSGFDVSSAYIPTQTTGKITTVAANKAVTVNGSTIYPQAPATSALITGTQVTDKTDATLWLNNAGGIIHWKANADKVPAYVYVLSVSETLANNKIVELADVVYSDGTKGTIPVKDLGGDDVDVGSYNVVTVKDGVYLLDNTAAPIASAASTGTMLAEATAAAGSGKPATFDVKYTVSTLPAKYAYVDLLGDGEIEATDKALTAAAAESDDGGTNDGKYYANYYADDVKFIYIDTTNATEHTVKAIATGVQKCKDETSGGGADTSLPAGSVAVVEKNAAGNYVVTAVILPGGTPNTTTDASKLIYITSETRIDTTLMPTADGKEQKKINVYAGYVGSEKRSIAIANDDGVVTAAGFYTMGENAAIPGSYNVAPLADATNKNVAKVNGVATAVQGSLITVTQSGAVTLTTSTATFVDCRSDAEKLAFPIYMDAESVATAIATPNTQITLTVLYDGTTNIAKIVYVTGAAKTYTINAVTPKDSTGNTVSNFTVTVETSPAVAGATITVKVKAGAKVDAATTFKLSSAKNSSITGTFAFAANDLANTEKSATFTMPAANIDDLAVVKQ